MTLPLRCLLALLAVPAGSFASRFLYPARPFRFLSGWKFSLFLGLLFALLALRARGIGSFLLSAAALWALFDAALCDLAQREIPDRALLLLLGCALFSLLLDGSASLQSRGLGLLLCLPLLLLSRLIHGLGTGDALLLCACGLLLGWQKLLGQLLFSLLACSLFAALGLFQKRLVLQSTLPFGPFVAAGAALMLLLFGL